MFKKLRKQSIKSKVDHHSIATPDKQTYLAPEKLCLNLHTDGTCGMASKKAGKHVTSNIACASNQRYTKDSVF